MPPSSKIVARSPETIIQEAEWWGCICNEENAPCEDCKSKIKSALASVVAFAAEEATPETRALYDQEKMYVEIYKKNLLALAEQIAK